MSKNRSYPYSFIYTLAILIACNLLPSSLKAQTKLGIRWQPPSDINLALAKLAEFEKLNISHIELTGNPNPVLLDTLTSRSFENVYLLSNYRFLTIFVLRNDSTITEDLRNWIRRYDSYPAITGYVLFRDSQTYDREFQNLIAPLYSELNYTGNKSIIYHTPFLSDQSVSGNLSAKLFLDVKDTLSAVGNFSRFYFDKTAYKRGDERVLNQLLSGNSSLIMVSSSWLDQAIAQNQDFEIAFQQVPLIATKLPVPKIDASLPNSNWNVFVLILLLLTIAIHFGFHPGYRSQIFRYFNSHNFFVKDIIEYRLRNGAHGAIILFQHLAACGLFFYYISRSSFSNIGLKSFFHNLPYISYLGDTFLSVFVIGILIAAAFQGIAFLWIYLFSPALKSSSQILNLYAWPLHINFVIITIMATLFQSGATNTFFYILAVIYVFVWFNAFNSAVVDYSKSMLRGKVNYFGFTIILHLVLSLTAVYLIVYYTPFLDAIELGYMLP